MLSVIRYIILFLMLLALQVFVFDNFANFNDVFVFQYNRPIIFFFFLLVLPRFSAAWLMVIAFFTGLFYDVFYYTPGIHAAACVLLAYIRDPLLRFFKKEEEGDMASVHVSYLGFTRYLYYVLIISLIFHLCVTFLTIFSFSEVGNTLLRAGIGTVLSVVLIYLFDIVFFYRKAAD